MKTTLKNRTNKTIGYRRYEVYNADTGRHLGWVCRFDGERGWFAHIAKTVNTNTEGYCSQLVVPSISLGGGFPTRQEALDDIATVLAIRFRYRENGELQ